MDELLNKLISPSKRDYKCYDLLRKMLSENKEFFEVVKKGVELGKIRGFDDELWIKISCTDTFPKISRDIPLLDDYFKVGFNVGTCSRTSMNLALVFSDCSIVGGTLPFIAGTNNSPDGRHTWIHLSSDSYYYMFSKRDTSDLRHAVIDTSLMLVIDDDYIKELGYVVENSYDLRTIPNIDIRQEMCIDVKKEKKIHQELGDIQNKAR